MKGTEAGEAARAKLNQQCAKEAKEAFLGYAYGSLDSRQAFKLSFGETNKRDIEKSKLNDLKKSFVEHGISPWKAPIPVLVDREWINLNTLTKEVINSNEGPVVEWTEKVKDLWVTFLGGQHRQKALEDRETALKHDAYAMNDKIEKLYKAKHNEAEKDAAMVYLKNLRENVLALQDDPLRWVLEFYDIGTCSVGARIAVC